MYPAADAPACQRPRTISAPPCLGKTLAALQLQCLQVFGGFTLARVVCVQLMEQRWRDRALTRSREALEERELLGLNPINWSGTLK